MAEAPPWFGMRQKIDPSRQVLIEEFFIPRMGMQYHGAVYKVWTKRVAIVLLPIISMDVRFYFCLALRNSRLL